MRKWYKNIFKSFFICIELSSIWATVKILILQFFQVRCCFNRKGRSIKRPPSWTIHQTSIFPTTFSVELGKKLIPFGTNNAIRAAVTFLTVCKKTCQVRSSSDCRQPYGQPRMTVFGFIPPKPVVWTLKNRNRSSIGKEDINGDVQMS